MEAANSQAGATPIYCYRFGTAEFDEARYELKVNGRTVELERKPLEVLDQLLRHAGEVVTREELYEHVWNGRPTVDHVLSNAIMKLRKALGSDNSERIITQPKIGYRLQGPVERTAVGRIFASHAQLQSGMAVPDREHFVLTTLLNRSHNSEVWIAQHAKTREARVYKFALDGERLATLKREATLHRVLTASAGQRNDLVRILDWNFAQAPYFLECEYAGQNLLDWASEHLPVLSQAQRLGLFLQNADAVAAAHSVGVLHKDLKPTNVLINGDADSGWQARLSDFGSGRLLEPERLDQLGITRMGMTVTPVTEPDSSGTPLYLAPEIMAGKSPSVHSDVYSLGLILYQLLVADLRRPMGTGWERDIEDPLLREDIAAATDRDPMRRLASVAQLRERLAALGTRNAERELRLLEQERLRCSEAAAERARSRRPWVIGAFTVLVIALTVSLGFFQLAQQRQRDAESSAAQARAVNEFLSEDILAAANPLSSPANNYTMAEALAAGAAKIDSRFQQQPERAVELYLTIAKSFTGLANYRAAYDNSQRALQTATKRLGALHRSTILARFAVTQSLAHLGKFPEAHELLQAADQQAAALPKDPEVALAAARSWAIYFDRHDEPNAAVPYIQRALQLQALLEPGNVVDDALWQRRLANAYKSAGRYQESLDIYRQLLARTESSNALGTGLRALLRLDHGRLLIALKRYGEAEQQINAALEESAAALEPDHYLVATAANALGALHVERGEWAKALTAFDQAYRMYRDRLGPAHSVTLKALANCAIYQIYAGHAREAIPQLREVKEGLQASAAPPATLQLVEFNLATALLETGDVGAALQLSKGLQADVLGRAGANNSTSDWQAKLDALRGKTLLMQGRRAEASALLEKSVAHLRRELPQTWHRQTAEAALQQATQRSYSTKPHHAA